MVVVMHSFTYNTFMGTGRMKIMYPVLLLFLFFSTPLPVTADTPDASQNHKVLKIVIDPGHGGKAPGAIGANGEKEKDITLTVSMELAKRLREKGYEVYLTRETDVYLPLEERTAFANKLKADLFICIHANANEKTSTQGVETYFLNLTADAASMKVAKRENGMNAESLSSLQLIIKDLMLNARINESSRFATSIHKSVVSSLGKTGYEGKDHGVRQAPFYVLVGAQMPSILLEMGFMTNAAECSLLQNETYQCNIIDGIISGIESFMTKSSFAFNNKGKEASEAHQDSP
jgi:N-acetylmuramoyl-L-alanine amidase